MFRQNRLSARKIATLGFLTTLGLVAFLIENAIPPLFGIPGARTGISNVFSLVALILYSPAEALIIVFARSFLGALFQANFSAVAFSLAGGLVSMTVSSVLFYTIYPKISLPAVSIVAAVLHNITQNTIYVLETGVVQNFSLLPYLSLIGVTSGALVGGICLVLFRVLPKKVLSRLEL